MAKYYFRNDDEMCHTIEAHIDFMKMNHLKSMIIYEAKREKTDGYFFCKLYGEICEVGESCGKTICGEYAPNNFINGRCKHYGYLYEKTDKTKSLKSNVN